jgi:Bacterial Ig domain
MAGPREAMSCLAALAALAAPGASAQVLSQTPVTSVGGANALSTPAARHLVRMDSGPYLLALQRDTALPDTGLQLYRSDDDGFSWTHYGALNATVAERQTADMLKVGADVAIVTSFDAPSIVPDATLDPGRKVYFQWWRSDGLHDWSAQPRVTVFSPSSGVAYHRGELAVDSRGRIWVQAFKRNPTSCDPATNPKCAVCAEVVNGDNYANEMVVSVSTDGGKTFAPEQSLATMICRAGGRLISVGTKLLLIWNDYSANENGTRILTRFMQRDAADPLTAWSVAKDAFPDEPADGIYHGAALSAVADSSGVHLVYKDQNQLKLWYRRFDLAAGTFGARVQVDDSQQDWALQPATTVRNGELFIAANHILGAGKYETRIWRQSTGLGVANAVALSAEDAFHGYPALPESVPASARSAPYVYTSAPTPDGSGNEISLRIALDRQVPLAVSVRGADPGTVIAGVARFEVDAQATSGQVAEVRLLVDGAPVATASTSPASFSWDTSRVADGSHDLSGIAVDDTGLLASSTPIRVDVRNGSPGGGGNAGGGGGGAGGCASTGTDQPLVALIAALGAGLRLRRRRRRFSSSCPAA